MTGLSLLTEKPVNGHMVRLLLPKHLYVWDTPSGLLYKFQLFSLIEVRLRECVALFVWPDVFCAWFIGCFLLIWPVVLVAFWSALNDQPSFTF